MQSYLKYLTIFSIFVKKGIQTVWFGLALPLAMLYRRLLPNVCFIGITGSCGKTTTKELAATILDVRYRGRKSNQMINSPRGVATTLFTVFPWHQYCVHELGGYHPGILAKTVKLFRPDMGVITHVGSDHYKAFRSLEATAKEKGTLVEVLAPEGTAILNADDPYVLPMVERTRARVMTYGLSRQAMIRGENISSVWPDRLSMIVNYTNDRVAIQTQLLGEHWAYTVLAAMSVGIAMGVSLGDGARAIETFQPVECRMSPLQTADGVMFILDTWKAPLWTIPVSLKFMQTAHAQRKVVVIGTISDYPGVGHRKYRAVARQALNVADKVIFVGPQAHSSLKARRHPDDDHLLAFDSLFELNEFLNHYLTSGDLVLLKWSNRADHLERLALSRTEEIACWREGCGKYIHCRDCRQKH